MLPRTHFLTGERHLQHNFRCHTYAVVSLIVFTPTSLTFDICMHHSSSVRRQDYGKMTVRVNLSILVILFLGLLTVECRRCFNYLSNSLRSSYPYRDCPVSEPKCCGIQQNTCVTTCEDFKCETNDDCDGLICCGGACTKSKSCLPLSTWGVVCIAVVFLFILLASIRACQWYRKRKVSTRQEEQTHNEPPFVVSDFDNHGFITPMAPPPYDSIVQNTGSRTDGNPPVYSLNLQTIINNSSRNDPSSNNFEVNISIRGATMFADDFPPSYNEIGNSNDNDGQPPLYTSSQGGAENFEERRLRLSYSDEPPSYSVNEESATDEFPNNNTRESESDTTTDSNIDEDSTVSHDNASSGELQTVSSSISAADTEQIFNNSSDVHETTSSSECRDEVSNNEQSRCNVNQDEETSLSNLSNNSNQSVYFTRLESTTTRF